MSQDSENLILFEKNISDGSLLDLSVSNKIYTFLNCYSYLIVRNKRESLSLIDHVFCDGILFQKMVNSIGIKVERTSFDMTSLAPKVFSYAQKNKKSIMLIGSELGVAERAKKILHEKYPELYIIEARHGYFSSISEREEYINHIVSLNPDFIIAGMGTPVQEKFLIDVKKNGWNGIGFTCGGFLHQTEKKGVKYYPKIIDKLNLRWFYRMVDEPKLIKRYAFYYPISIAMFYYDYLTFKLIK